MKKPVHTVEFKGTPWEVNYLDGVAVALETYSIRGSELESWRLTGSQEQYPYALSRPSKFDPDTYYYAKDQIIVSTKRHMMVSEHPDMSEWTTVSKPLSMIMFGGKSA